MVCNECHLHMTDGSTRHALVRYHFHLQSILQTRLWKVQCYWWGRAFEIKIKIAKNVFLFFIFKFDCNYTKTCTWKSWNLYVKRVGREVHMAVQAAQACAWELPRFRKLLENVQNKDDLPYCRCVLMRSGCIWSVSSDFWDFLISNIAWSPRTHNNTMTIR